MRQTFGQDRQAHANSIGREEAEQIGDLGNEMDDDEDLLVATTRRAHELLNSEPMGEAQPQQPQQ
jgi:hypothetical protein